MEWVAENGWVLDYQLTSAPKRQRTMQAMACLSLGARVYPPSKKATIPTDIFRVEFACVSLLVEVMVGSDIKASGINYGIFWESS